MDSNPQQILNIIVIGVALASTWFWVYSLIRGLRDEQWKQWLKFVVPQGILISFALHVMGVI